MRQQLREMLQNGNTTIEAEQELIAELDSLAQQNGPEILRQFFKTLSGLEFSDQVAIQHWMGFKDHLKSLSLNMERNVRLLTGLCDYLLTNTSALVSPRLIEQDHYEGVVHDTTHDGLTGLYNRAYFDQAYQQQISQASRYGNCFSLLFLDIDNFKDINDTYGHLGGDEALKRIGQTILEEKRESDIGARYGGEEFVLLMTHTDNVSGYVFAERLRRKLQSLVITYKEHSFSVTVSGGLAAFPFNSTQPEKLLEMADSAVYLAKGAGKNTISHYKEEKRRYLRVKITQPILVKELDFQSSKTFSGQSKDICVGGILFENSKPIPLNSLITVQIPVSGSEPLILVGKVVRVESYDNDKYDIGMTTSFKEMDKLLSREIEGILRHETLDEATPSGGLAS